MLKVVNGNLFDGLKGRCVIAHGCNAHGVMGAGFAEQMRLKFPLNYLEYRSWCLSYRVKLGQWILVHEGDIAVYNLITQETYGNDKSVVYVDYDAVKKGLRDVEKYGRIHSVPIHLPFIGAGKGNGDAAKLMSIFEEVFDKTDAMLYLKPTRKKAK